MPSKKKKYNARFPAGRIKKIMQTDEEVGKVAQAVPVIISRTLELFVESLLTKSMQITQTRSARTLTPSHMKQCILSESRFDFLKDLVKNIPDPSVQEDNENNAVNENMEIAARVIAAPESVPVARTPVIQYGPRVAQMEHPKPDVAEPVEEKLDCSAEPTGAKFHIDLSHVVAASSSSSSSSPPPPLDQQSNDVPASSAPNDNIPPLIPISHNVYGQSSSDNNLYIDEDYDN